MPTSPGLPLRGGQQAENQSRENLATCFFQAWDTQHLAKAQEAFSPLSLGPGLSDPEVEEDPGLMLAGQLWVSPRVCPLKPVWVSEEPLEVKMQAYMVLSKHSPPCSKACHFVLLGV